MVTYEACPPKKAPITVEMKTVIIQKYEESKRIIDIDQKYGKPSSIITTILKKKGDIKGFVECPLMSAY